MTLAELQAAFDRDVKERILKGEPPEEAVPAAASELGIALPPEVTQQIVAVLRHAMALRHDPEALHKRDVLNARIRHLAKSGRTLQQAVREAQDDTGIQLGPEATALLIEMLEKESERWSKVGVEVVSDAEFEQMTRGKTQH